MLAIVAGYALGSVPFAQLASKYRGIDIFRTGSRSAGTANVFWNVGRGTGIVVLLGDVSKASAAIVFALLMGLSWPLILIVTGAIILGHWNSVFSGFRGGDGMAPLMGAFITLEPVLAALGLLMGTSAMLLLWRSPLRGPGALLTCLMVILAVSHYYQIDRGLVMGLVVLGFLVLFHSVVYRRTKMEIFETEEFGLGFDENPDLGEPTAENH